MNQEDIAKEMKLSMSTLQNFLRTPNGRIAIKCIEVEFGGSLLVKGDPYTTHSKIGHREVIDYLMSLRDGENV